MLMLSLTMPSLLQLMMYLLMSNPTNRMVFILLKHVSLLAWQISYDYLVLATGSTYRSQFKSSDTSTLYRASQLDDEMEQLKAAKSILIIGGGLVGCELASEISRSYNGINRHRKQITLIESSPSLVPRSTQKQSQNAYNYLQKLGVQVVLGERLYQFEDFDGDKSIYLGASGTRYDSYDKIYFATGTKPSSDILLRETDEFENCIDCNGRICVKTTLQVDHWNYQHVFAGGDVTNVKEEKTGYAATLAGVVIARNICRMEKNKPPINQSAKGTIAPPQQPLHGVHKHGGVGKGKNNYINLASLISVANH
jgi:NADH dehydrogenase FAD-containing subunit